MSELPATSIEESDTSRLYSSLGVRPVINAAGAYTTLGGSQLSPGVRKAMDDANRYFVDMKALLQSSGVEIAATLGAEAALVTSGAAAALVLSVAACLTKDHPEYLERLPDTDGIPNEVIVQLDTRQKYDHVLQIPGAKIIEAGDENGLTLDQLEAAITPRTVAVHYFVPLKGPLPGVPALEDVVAVAHRHNLPVIVDAAGHTYPLDNMRKYTRAGADLVCFAAKYFDAPHSTGMVIGRKDLVDCALTNSFVGFETSGYLTIGRPMKVDRQEIFGLMAALREWFETDHESRFSTYGARCEVILDALRGIPGYEFFRITERDIPRPVVREGVRIVPDGTRLTNQQIIDAMLAGDPCIKVREDDDTPGVVNVSVAFCTDDEVELIARRLREVLTS